MIASASTTTFHFHASVVFSVRRIHFVFSAQYSAYAHRAARRAPRHCWAIPKKRIAYAFLLAMLKRFRFALFLSPLRLGCLMDNYFRFDEEWFDIITRHTPTPRQHDTEFSSFPLAAFILFINRHIYASSSRRLRYISDGEYTRTLLNFDFSRILAPDDTLLVPLVAWYFLARFRIICRQHFRPASLCNLFPALRYAYDSFEASAAGFGCYAGIEYCSKTLP